MKLLVTGGAGFIGSHFVESCVDLGNEVIVLDDFNDFYAPSIKRANLLRVADQVQIFEADLRNRPLISSIVSRTRPDVIVHLAARAGVRPSIQDPELYLDTNIKGTFHLLDAARNTGVSRFIFASSSSVYGTIKTAPFREDMCINQTISPYAASKLAAEQLCSNYSHLYGMRCVCLRFFTVYGPRQRPDLAIHAFTRAILEGRTIRQFGDGSTRRDYTYISDILQGLLASLTYEGPLCDVFNLGENETTSLSKLLDVLQSTLQREARIEVLPEQPGDVPLTFADITKARTLLGYAPTTKISEGIPRFVEWFLQTQSLH
ncbi:MAG: NAD-dependent epimerase/dehydratase family protein [Verrucomicrobia bacterium]|nr:NAD-dependent epimerase/dehydratase family protein [Verrucomicrobiota bacterium]